MNAVDAAVGADAIKRNEVADQEKYSKMSAKNLIGK